MRIELPAWIVLPSGETINIDQATRADIQAEIDEIKQGSDYQRLCQLQKLLRTLGPGLRDDATVGSLLTPA